MGNIHKNNYNLIKNSRPFKVLDAVICLSLIAVFTLGIFLLMPKGEGFRAEVYKDGRLIKVLPLNVDDVFIYEQDGEYNKIMVSGGKVFIQSASCDDKLCINHPPTDTAGSTIICLPHRLVIIVKGEGGVDYTVSMQVNVP